MDTFGIATLASLKQKLSAFEQRLMNSDQQIDSNILNLNSTFQSINITDIDAQTSSTSEKFDDWMQAQLDAVAASQASLHGIGTVNPINDSTVDIRTNSTVNGLALAAQTLLSQYNIDLPRIDQIVTETAWTSPTASVPSR